MIVKCPSSLTGQSAVVAEALLELAGDEFVLREAPEAGALSERLLRAGEEEEAEGALSALYGALHRAGSLYSEEEMSILDSIQGYPCIASGISPLIKAAEFIRPGSVVADLGAGNGLQGLLMQRLSPHRLTLQAELSSELIRVGRIYRRALGIPEERIRWINGDMLAAPLDGVDIAYIYLPAKPVDGEMTFYDRLALKLISIDKPLLIFSVSDCLSGLLRKDFDVFLADGHLTCLKRKQTRDI